jgi:hypothetical protein
MSKGPISYLPSVFVLPLSALFLVLACSKQAAAPPKSEQVQQPAVSSPLISADGLPAAPSKVVALPIGFTRDTGDLDSMVKRRQIRALVILNPIGFFYDKGCQKAQCTRRWRSFKDSPTKS